jgi:hypothetical protein
MRVEWGEVGSEGAQTSKLDMESINLRRALGPERKENTKIECGNVANNTDKGCQPTTSLSTS